MPHPDRYILHKSGCEMSIFHDYRVGTRAAPTADASLSPCRRRVGAALAAALAATYVAALAATLATHTKRFSHRVASRRATLDSACSVAAAAATSAPAARARCRSNVSVLARADGGVI